METRGYSDRREYLINSVAERRRKLRQKATQYMGGRCIFCGYDRDNKALGFHHIDQSKKPFGLLERGFTRSWVKIVEELNKCVLVCASCHRVIHSGVRQIGTD